ncbi:hypothetical protein ACFWY5_57735, partial [Nonomuraea sp. NPDC059007]|uniref:hypothetical protein n=1 Tax=Nonomuraea sp. NPDC059007 TaxID=3346692 RepID=UPI003674B373
LRPTCQAPSRPPHRDAIPTPTPALRPRSVERLLQALAGHDGHDDADHDPQAPPRPARRSSLYHCW